MWSILATQFMVFIALEIVYPNLRTNCLSLYVINDFYTINNIKFNASKLIY